MSDLFNEINHLSDTLFAIVAAAVIILACFGMWIILRLRAIRQPGDFVAFETPNGQVSVARTALAELIQKAATSIDGVVRCSARIFLERGLLSIRLRIHLKANHPLTDVAGTLEQRVSESIKRIFGIANIGPIHTRVTNLIGEPRAGGSSQIEPFAEEREFS